MKTIKKFFFRLWLTKTQRAYQTLTDAMKKDQDFAHTWQCNIVCPLVDAGMNYKDANAAADRLMRHLFGVVNYTEPMPKPGLSVVHNPDKTPGNQTLSSSL